jgi:hypothetical protein
VELVEVGNLLLGPFGLAELSVRVGAVVLGRNAKSVQAKGYLEIDEVFFQVLHRGEVAMIWH